MNKYMRRCLEIVLLCVLFLVVGCAHILPTGGAPRINTEKFLNTITNSESIVHKILPTSEKLDGQVLKVRCLYIGQGDAALITWQGQNILIDTGDVEHRPELVRLLEKYGVKQVDKMIITHPDSDHLGGAYAVLKHFPVTEVYDNGQEKITATYRTYLKMLLRKKIKPETLREGASVDLGGGARLRVVSPGAQLLRKGGQEDYNNNSIVCRLEYGDFTMLFTGDAEKEQEREILQRHSRDLQSLVLKVGHHGSKTSSTMAFLQAVQPKIAIISCGKNNPYHVPHAPALRNLAAVGAKVYRTDQDGTVTVVTNGKEYRVETQVDSK